jgi:Carboxypeptidase regulatory-like domain
MKALLLSAIVPISMIAQAQEIQGKVTNVMNQPLAGVTMTAYLNNKAESVGHTTTDARGNYDLKCPVAGTYTVRATSNGYDTMQTKYVPVWTGNATLQNYVLPRAARIARKTELVFSGTPEQMEAATQLTQNGGRTYTNASQTPEHGANSIPNWPPPETVDDIPTTPNKYYRGRVPETICCPEGRTAGTVYIIDGEEPISKPNRDTVRPWSRIVAPGHYRLDHNAIEAMPYNSVYDMIAEFPGVYQARRGDEPHIYGAR